ncbi:hypothetical protein INR49_031551 [Caranx melampygus]|nr:hypothetical protein INR49_031551 [Caranx melampygus]
MLLKTTLLCSAREPPPLVTSISSFIDGHRLDSIGVVYEVHVTSSSGARDDEGSKEQRHDRR